MDAEAAEGDLVLGPCLKCKHVGSLDHKHTGLGLSGWREKRAMCSAQLLQSSICGEGTHCLSHWI